MARPHRGRGFTLIELLVASVVIGVLMLGVYHTFSTGLLAWESTEAELGTLQEARNFMANLEAELGSAQLPLPKDQPSFVAGPAHLFIS